MDTTAGSLWMEPKNIMENKEIFFKRGSCGRLWGCPACRESSSTAQMAGHETTDGLLPPGNYGIVLNRETLVVDIDPRNAKGANVLHRLVLDCPGLKRCH